MYWRNEFLDFIITKNISYSSLTIQNPKLVHFRLVERAPDEISVFSTISK